MNYYDKESTFSYTELITQLITLCTWKIGININSLKDEHIELIITRNNLYNKNVIEFDEMFVLAKSNIKFCKLIIFGKYQKVLQDDNNKQISKDIRTSNNKK